VQSLRKTVGSARPEKAKASALEVSGLTVRFGARTILDAINFDVREGEFLCIVGSSGSGKTTLLRVLAGLARPAEGKVLFAGSEISGPSRDRAIIFQDYSKALLPWRTVRGNVALSLEARNVPAAEQNVVIEELLGIMGLSQTTEQFPSQLSGGMQQRVQIARCLAQNPKLLLMDEPFGALDAMTRQALQDEILQLVADKKIATVFITHDLEEAIYLGDRVIVLGGSPAGIMETMEIDLPRPRNQLTTREDGRFLAYRHRLFEMLVHERTPQPFQNKGQH
jgi:NitT/TauT family transport system ATP-binding protein